MKRRVLQLISAFAAVVALIIFPATIFAANVNWGAGSSNWSNASNWTPGQVPTTGDLAFILGSDGVSRTVTYDYSGPAVTLDSLYLDLSNATGAATDTLSIPAVPDISVVKTLSATTEIIGNNGSGTYDNYGVNKVSGVLKNSAYR